MKNNVIFTVSIGNQYKYTHCIDSIKQYSIKCDADFLILTDYQINFVKDSREGPYTHFEKFYFLRLLSKYDRLLFLDADILVTPHARNIFDIYNNKELFYAFDENSNQPYMDRDWCISPMLEEVPGWPKNSHNKRQYFNSGVFIASNYHKNLLPSEITLPNNPHIYAYHDQTFFNYLIQKNNIKFTSIDENFNRMFLEKPDPTNSRYGADFIHYAGTCPTGKTKIDQMVADYECLYNS